MVLPLSALELMNFHLKKVEIFKPRLGVKRYVWNDEKDIKWEIHHLKMYLLLRMVVFHLLC